MENNTLFLRCTEKKASGVVILTKDNENYPCLTKASTSHYYSTTHLQYIVVQIFNNLYSLLSEWLHTCSWNVHSIWTHTNISLRWTSQIFWEVSCHWNSVQLLLEQIVNTDYDDLLQKKYGKSLELFCRMCKVFENFVSLKH